MLLNLPSNMTAIMLQHSNRLKKQQQQQQMQTVRKKLVIGDLILVHTFLALQNIRNALAIRNSKPCRPKFLMKPKTTKTIAEHKSLRLKAAISANPAPIVEWDFDGVILLETGNKYSIYNDGDFYYLEVRCLILLIIITFLYLGAPCQ
jgi:hydrogenase maturation factor